MLTKEREKVKIEDARGSESLPLIYYKVDSYGSDQRVEDVVRRLNSGRIYIPPFQRNYVWSLEQAASFIESLLIGLPIPTIFLAQVPQEQKSLVIDGSQRLRTLKYFYSGKFGEGSNAREFALREVHPDFEGRTYQTLNVEDRFSLDEYILRITTIAQKTPSDDDSSMYQIFRRLNTGGTILKPQEIRAALYQGRFIDLIRHLNHSNEQWRSIFGEEDRHMRDQELILRFFALYYKAADYSSPLDEFLNSFVRNNRELHRLAGEELVALFDNTINVIYSCIHNKSDEKAFRPGKRALNAAAFDAVMVGIARRLQEGTISDCATLKQHYDELLNNTDFKNAITTGTAFEKKVATRIDLATKAFANLQ